MMRLREFENKKKKKIKKEKKKNGSGFKLKRKLRKIELAYINNIGRYNY